MKEDWAKHWPAPSVYSQPFLLQHHDATGAHDGRISWALGFIMYLKANKYYWAEILIREAHLKDYKNVPPRRKYAPYPVLLGPCPVVQRGSSDSLQRLSSAWCASRSGWLPSGCSGAAGLSPVPCSGCCPHTDSRANVTAGNERWCFQPQEEEEEEREEGAAMVVVRAVWGGFGGSKRDGVSLPPSPPSLPPSSPPALPPRFSSSPPARCSSAPACWWNRCCQTSEARKYNSYIYLRIWFTCTFLAVCHSGTNINNAGVTYLS